LPRPHFLRPWDDAPAILLSCPGPLRRQHAAVQPIADLTLPQCLLGSEAQLLAFVAAQPALATRLFFLPLPEIFASPASMAALTAACGATGAARLVHLRFGGTRSARVLKDARNALVLAEHHRTPPITASRHPFASGLVVPPTIRRILALHPGLAIPANLGGHAPNVTVLEGDVTAADLHAPTPPEGAGHDLVSLDLVSLAEFRTNAWAAGPLRHASAHMQAARDAAARDQAPFVLVPWNLDDFGSAVPALVARTQRLQRKDQPAVRLVIMPFNYPGQTGLIRRLIRQLRQTIEDPVAALAHLFLGRLTSRAALPALRQLARVAWVDGNDPEHDWTMQRLAAAGFAPVLLAAGDPPRPGTVQIAADDQLTIAAETRFGLLHYHAQLPSLRALRALLALTRDVAQDGTQDSAGDKRPRVRRKA
jgi:hypothetical protein